MMKNLMGEKLFNFMKFEICKVKKLRYNLVKPSESMGVWLSILQNYFGQL